jgi:hypothetical protein
MRDLLTISDLRRITGEPVHVLNHAIDRHGPEPAGRVGITRLWSSEQLAAIRDALRKTAERSTVARRRREVCA